jgi:hypothetical protein
MQFHVPPIHFYGHMLFILCHGLPVVLVWCHVFNLVPHAYVLAWCHAFNVTAHASCILICWHAFNLVPSDSCGISLSIVLPPLQVQTLKLTGDSGSNPKRAHGDTFLLAANEPN